LYAYTSLKLVLLFNETGLLTTVANATDFTEIATGTDVTTLPSLSVAFAVIE
jgi:hypothetical protein